jgi:hypothetical protein
LIGLKLDMKNDYRSAQPMSEMGQSLPAHSALAPPDVRS